MVSDKLLSLARRMRQHEAGAFPMHQATCGIVAEILEGLHAEAVQLEDTPVPPPKAATHKNFSVVQGGLVA